MLGAWWVGLSSGGCLRQETRRDGWPVHASAEPPFIHSSDPPFPFDQFIRFDHSIGPILSLICCPHIPPSPSSCHHWVGHRPSPEKSPLVIDFFKQSNVVFTIYPNTKYQLLALSGSLTWPDLAASQTMRLKNSTALSWFFNPIWITSQGAFQILFEDCLINDDLIWFYLSPFHLLMDSCCQSP